MIFMYLSATFANKAANIIINLIHLRFKLIIFHVVLNLKQLNLNPMKTRVLYPILSLLMVLITACSKDSTNVTEEDTFPVAEVEVDLQSEFIADQIDDIAEAIAADEVFSAKSETFQKPALPECVVITTTMEGGVITRVVDFGSGCALANGLEYAGKLIMLITRDFEMRKAEIVVETEGFYVNNLAVTGRKEIARTWPEAVGSGVPSSVVVTELKVEHPEGIHVEVAGTTTREWVEGYGSGTWGDNVVLIGGERTVKTFLAEVLVKTYQATITDKLRRAWACRFIVSGTMEISKNEFSASLDFGDGNCDNKALLTTASGATKEIILR